MDFTCRKINKSKTIKSIAKTFHKSRKKKTQKKYWKIIITLLILSFVIISLMWLKSLAKGIKINKLIPSFLTKEIQTDPYNHSNFLILGVGGENHEGGNLTDTMIVVSLDHDSGYTSMLSLPRDLWIDQGTSGSRINQIYELAMEKNNDDSAYGLNYLKQTIENIVGIPIHYYVKVDFQAAIAAVDAVGGIDIYLDKKFYDPLYPKEGTLLYEYFTLPAGNNHLTGKTALKYLRSRHSTSDFDRSARQQQIISLVKDKALSLKILGNPSRLKKLYDSIQNNIETNLTWKEIIYIGKIADNFSTSNLIRSVINDNPVSVGGFLYTPERKYYGGAYVLVPHTNDYQEIQELANLVLRHPYNFKKQTPIQLLNVSRGNGLATSTKRMLIRHGFNVIRYGNGKDQNTQTTTIYYKDPENRPTIIDDILKIIPAVESTNIPLEYQSAEYQSEAEVIIELGKDFLSTKNANYRKFNY